VCKKWQSLRFQPQACTVIVASELARVANMEKPENGVN
jgi:hypothetical protein